MIDVDARLEAIRHGKRGWDWADVVGLVSEVATERDSLRAQLNIHVDVLSMYFQDGAPYNRYARLGECLIDAIPRLIAAFEKITAERDALRDENNALRLGVAPPGDLPTVEELAKQIQGILIAPRLGSTAEDIAEALMIYLRPWLRSRTITQAEFDKAKAAWVADGSLRALLDAIGITVEEEK